MEEVLIDNWFFSLPACWQMDIAGIYMNEDTATETDYVRFDLAVTDWWDALSYWEKLTIYNTETTFPKFGTELAI